MKLITVKELTILILTRNHVYLWLWISEVLHFMRSKVGWYSQYETNYSDGHFHISAMSHRKALVPENTHWCCGIVYPFDELQYCCEPTMLIFTRGHVVWARFRGTPLWSLTILILTRNHVCLWLWISEVLHYMRIHLDWYSQYELKYSDEVK